MSAGIIDFETFWFSSMTEASSVREDIAAAPAEEYESLLNELLSTRPDLIPSSPDSTQLLLLDGTNQQSTHQMHQAQLQQQFHLQQSQPHHFTMNDLMHAAFSELRMIVEWARKVPRFATLQMGDRVSMLKRSFVDLYLTRLIFRSIGTENRLMFSDSILLTLEECLSLGWNEEVIRSSLTLVDQFKKLKVDRNEFAILCAIVLFYPDVPNLINRQQVLTAQNNLISCLQHYNDSRFHDDSTRPGKIILRLVGIRSTSSGILKQFVKCTMEGQVQMDDLVIEMMS